MLLHSKEPPEHPCAPMDLSHHNLICICHWPSLDLSPSCCYLSFSFLPPCALSPIRPPVASIPYPQNCCMLTSTSPKAHLAACSANVKTVALANLAVPCIRPINITLEHSCTLWTI